MPVLYLIIGLLPLGGGLLALIQRQYGAWISTGILGIASVISLYGLISFENWKSSFEWIPGITFQWSGDSISMWLVFLVGLISFLVHLFSLKYMETEARKSQYFAMLGLFTTSMVGVLLSDHLILLFIFWELVGFSSYLLIGFWFQEEENATASRIAFITNRVADAFMIMGISWSLALGAGVLSEDFQEGMLPFAASLLLILGCFGKSAQLPFLHWLPRAMAGPTPVSALIHAATMVAAGIYLLVRLSPFLHPAALDIVALVGAFTAFAGGFSALTQWDIKKVLAYSTVSQLGYMTMAVGVGAREMALFHLWTHAFFKAGLFLMAGVIIHYIHHADPDKDAQDMRNMGGLKQAMPIVYWGFVICAASLAGLPFLSGFLSKEGIINATFIWASGATWRWAVAALAILTILLTAFYMTRQIHLIFYGDISERKKRTLSWLYILPVLILSMGSIWIWYSWNPFAHHFAIVDHWFADDQEKEVINWLPILSVSLVATGIYLAIAKLQGKVSFTFSGIQTAWNWSYNALFIDHFYQSRLLPVYQKASRLTHKVDATLIDPLVDRVGVSFVLFSKLIDIMDKVVVDGVLNFGTWLVRLIGDVIRLFHSRRVQLQIFWVVTGVIIILVFLVVI